MNRILILYFSLYGNVCKILFVFKNILMLCGSQKCSELLFHETVRSVCFLIIVILFRLWFRHILLEWSSLTMIKLLYSKLCSSQWPSSLDCHYTLFNQNGISPHWDLGECPRIIVNCIKINLFQHKKTFVLLMVYYST